MGFCWNILKRQNDEPANAETDNSPNSKLQEIKSKIN